MQHMQNSNDDTLVRELTEEEITAVGGGYNFEFGAFGHEVHITNETPSGSGWFGYSAGGQNVTGFFFYQM